MKRFSQLTQTATEADLVAGNFLAIDVPGVGGVTKKVPGNLIAPKSVQDSIRDSLAPRFDETKDYVIGQVVNRFGVTYRFLKEHPAGAWDDADVSQIVISKIIDKSAVNSFGIRARTSLRVGGFVVGKTYSVVPVTPFTIDSEDPNTTCFDIAYKNGTNLSILKSFQKTAANLAIINNGFSFVAQSETLQFWFGNLEEGENALQISELFSTRSEVPEHFTLYSKYDASACTARMYGFEAGRFYSLDIDKDSWSSVSGAVLEIYAYLTDNTIVSLVLMNLADMPIKKNYAFYVPENTNYIGIFYRASAGNTLGVSIKDVTTEVKDVAGKLVWNKGLISVNTGMLSIPSSLNVFCGMVDVSQVSAVLCTMGVSTATSDSGVCFYDENIDWISGVRQYTNEAELGYRDRFIPVPKGAKWMRCSFYTQFLEHFKMLLVPNGGAIADKISRDEIFGTPKLYISENTASVYTNINAYTTQSLYDAYDALVTAHPKFFSRGTDIAQVTRDTDSEVFDIRQYRLNFADNIIIDHEPANTENVSTANNIVYRPRIKVLINGGMHGEEKTPCWGLMLAFQEILESDEQWARFIKNNLDLHIIPCLNPAGWDICRRGNCNNKVLNREEAWEEPETIAYMAWIEANKDAKFLLDCHGTQGFYEYAPIQSRMPFGKKILELTNKISTDLYESNKAHWQAVVGANTYSPYLIGKITLDASWEEWRLSCGMFQQSGMQEFALETPDNLVDGQIGNNDLRNCKLTKELFINFLQRCVAEKIWESPQ